MNNRLFKLLYLACFIIILYPSIAEAQDKLISYVEKGNAAPFAGVLLTPEAFAELKIAADVKDEQIKIEVDYKVKSALLDQQLRFDTLTIMCKSDKDSYIQRLALKDGQIDDLYKSLEKASKKTIWQKLNGPINFTGGVAFSLLMFYAHSKVIEISK